MDSFENISPLLKLSVHRAIFRLAIPSMGSMLFITLFELVDIFWVGHLGKSALAAISGSSFIIWALYAIAELAASGSLALISREFGILNFKKASYFANQAIWLVILFAIPLTILTYLFRFSLIGFLDLEPMVAAQAESYLRIVFLSMLIIYLVSLFDSFFRAAGDTFTPMVILIVFVVLNGILDPFFIFGWWIFPRMELEGAAIATVIARTLGAIIAFCLLKKKHFHLTLLVKPFGTVLWKIVKIGFPVALGGFTFSVVYVLLAKILSHFGSVPLAALGVGHRIEGIVYFVCLGFSFSIQTLVGQNLGARRLNEAEKATWWTLLYASLSVLLFLLFYVLIPDKLMGVFTSDSDVIREGAKYLRIISVFEIFLAWELIFEGAFSGAGDTIPPMSISILFTLARVPLAYYLAISLGWGTIGVWWAIAVSTGIKGILMAGWFKKGRWKLKRI